MEALVLGAGMMGRAIAYDLVRRSGFSTVTLADADTHVLKEAGGVINDPACTPTVLDVADTRAVATAFRAVDLVISAVPYRFNATLASLAIQAGVHFLDLGGNNDIVAQEKTLHTQAVERGVTCIPDLGLAPGLVSVITRDIVESLDTVSSVALRVGGLPVTPLPPLDYQLVFSAEGLLNEYVEDALVLEDGVINQVPSLTRCETLRFKPPFGVMEAFLTSGGCSTLPYTYRDRIGHLDYKTIRYPGHCSIIKALVSLGLAGTDVVSVGSARVVPRDLLVTLLKRQLPSTGPDVVLLKAWGIGSKEGTSRRLDYGLVDYHDPLTGLSAMMRTTGFPVSIIAELIRKDVITARGVYTPEEIVPFAPLRRELATRGVRLTRRMT